MAEPDAEKIMLKYNLCDEWKSADAVAYLLLKEGGKMDYRRVLNLLYMAERLCAEKEFELYFCGSLAITPKGPVIYEIQELIKGNKKLKSKYAWDFKLNKPEGYKLSVKPYINTNHLYTLHEYFTDIIDEVYDNFGDMSQDELLEFMNTNFPECRNFRVNENFTPSLIDLDILLEDLEYSNLEIKQFKEQMDEDSGHAIFNNNINSDDKYEDLQDDLYGNDVITESKL